MMKESRVLVDHITIESDLLPDLRGILVKVIEPCRDCDYAHLAPCEIRGSTESYECISLRRYQVAVKILAKIEEQRQQKGCNNGQ